MANAPSADEQFLLELINRFRANPAAEAALLTGPGAQANVLSAISYFGVSVSAFQQQLAGLAAAAPLAWNDLLATAADNHNQAMIAVDQQTHQAPGEPDLAQRTLNVGYSYRSLGENVYAFAADVVNAHAGFVVDWGYDTEDYDNGVLASDFRTRGDGIQDPAGHRINLVNSVYTEVGISLTAETNPATQVGPLVVTEDFGTRFNYQPQFLGVVFNDLDRDAFYDVGEGLGGVSVTLQSGASTFTTTSTASGGWQLAVPSGTYSITFSGGGLSAPVIKTATIGTVNVKVDAIAGSTPAPTRAVLNDFNGDGRADILWRNDNGTLSDWVGTATGGFRANDSNAQARVSNDWHIAGTGDFNGDGRSDILWRNDNGALSNWLGNASGGFNPNDGNAYRQVSVDWHIAGTGDFNGDGRSDILWRNDNGSLSNWLGNANGGFSPNDGNAFTRIPNDWRIVGTGDFNGDGRSDILWRNSDGTLSDWLGNAAGGFAANDGNASTRVGNEWKVIGTGDFNGDGRTDILWRNNDGTLSDWLGRADGGFSPNDANALSRVPNDWKVAATGDYNGDGRTDILWRNDNGTLSDWLGNANGGFSPNDANASSRVPNDWHVQTQDYILG